MSLINMTISSASNFTSLIFEYIFYFTPLLTQFELKVIIHNHLLYTHTYNR